MSADSVLRKSSATEHFLWRLCKTYAQEFPDPMRPVRSELVAAFVPRAVRLLVLACLFPELAKGLEAASEVMPEACADMASELGKVLRKYSSDLVSEIVEIDTWLHEPGVDDLGCGDWLVEHGYGFQEVKELLTRAKKYQSGRRPTKRLSTVAALELKTLNQNYTWRQLVLEFCDCEKSAHDKHCMEALRKSVAQLRSTLKKYRTLPVPAEMLAPLADLFLQQLGTRRPD